MSTPLQSVPVGTPIDHTAVFILAQQGDDKNLPATPKRYGPISLEIAEHGELGEVCVAGASVAAGYLGLSLTAIRYLMLPLLTCNLHIPDTCLLGATVTT